ncbi:N-6 DNA methylase [Paraburkholderia sp. XV]|uniref:N-6 DNA methylase n=1 Tax=Paraburkholderia sp. XV TaxID=2831520 RepID=UPI001CD330E6|nr:N-6 DNA methylase [Paraburkholderia sp. XV]
MSRKTAQRKHDLTADSAQKELVKLIQSFSYGHHLHTVFSDFVEMSALAISNSADRAQFEAREKRYLEIVGKYKREEVERFPQMLGLLVESFGQRMAVIRKETADGLPVSGGLTDVLGETYMMLGLGNDRAGQFFTPYSVSRMMSMMLMGNVGEEIERRGFLRVHEPACGAGGMVIAAADSILAAGHNFQQAMHATCIDIDPCCVHMTYVQLSLLHVPATVVHGNALSMEVWGTWYTPAHILGGWTFKLRRRLEADLLRDSVALEQQPAVDVAESPDVLPEVAIEAEVETADVEVLERETPQTTPAQVSRSATSLAELFEQSLASGTRERTVFDTIDQLTLF